MSKTRAKLAEHIKRKNEKIRNAQTNDEVASASGSQLIAIDLYVGGLQTERGAKGGRKKVGHKTAWTKTVHMMVDRLGVKSGAELIRCLDDLEHVKDELLRSGFDEYPQFDITCVRGDHILFVDLHDAKKEHKRKLSSVKSAANKYLRRK